MSKTLHATLITCWLLTSGCVSMPNPLDGFSKSDATVPVPTRMDVAQSNTGPWANQEAREDAQRLERQSLRSADEIFQRQADQGFEQLNRLEATARNHLDEVREPNRQIGASSISGENDSDANPFASTERLAEKPSRFNFLKRWMN